MTLLSPCLPIQKGWFKRRDDTILQPFSRIKSFYVLPLPHEFDYSPKYVYSPLEGELQYTTSVFGDTFNGNVWRSTPHKPTRCVVTQQCGIFDARHTTWWLGIALGERKAARYKSALDSSSWGRKGSLVKPRKGVHDQSTFDNGCGISIDVQRQCEFGLADGSSTHASCPLILC